MSPVRGPVAMRFGFDEEQDFEKAEDRLLDDFARRLSDVGRSTTPLHPERLP